MTASEIAKLIHSERLLPLPNGLEIVVVVRDGKSAYGTDRLLVTPKAGQGEAWVNLDSTRELNPL